MAEDVIQLFVVCNLRVHGFMQLQCNVGIFGGVFGSRFYRNLVDPDLLGTLAGNFFKADGFDAKMAFAQGIHAMRFMRFEHVGLQQRVVRDAVQGNAVVIKMGGLTRKFNFYNLFKILAGLPATVVPAVTFFVTTAPAPMIA